MDASAGPTTARVRGQGGLRSALFLLAVLALLGLGLVLSAPASATIRYVDDSYGGDNPGLNQWTTIQKAINNATNGDTIYIFAGTYTEAVIVNKTLNVQGESRNSTVVDPLVGSGLTIQANNVNLSSFTVTGALYGVTISSPYVNLVIDSLTFEQNTRGLNTNLVTNVTVSASYFGNHSGPSNAGIYASRGANVTSRNNTFIGNYYGVFFDRVVTGIVRDGEAKGNRYGAYFASARGTVVDRNHVGNSSLFSGYGLYFFDDHNSTVSSNRIDNITLYGLAVANSFSMEILQNDISDCGSNFYLSPGNDLLGRYYGHSIAASNLFDGKPAYYYKNTTNVSVPSGAGWVGAFNVTDLTIAAQNITNQQYAVWLVSVANVRLSGLNFSNARSAISGNGVYAYNVTNAVFSGINITGRAVAAYVTSSTAVSIENASVAGNRSLPISYSNLLYVNTVSGLRVLNNTVAYGYGGSIYYSDYALIQNNAVTDSYFGFTLGYGAYPRLFANTFNNTSEPLTPYGFDLSHYSWTLPINNTWDGRAVRAFVNTTTTTVSANYAWLLLANVSNLTVYSYSVNNGSGYAGVVAYSSNVSIGNLTQNSSSNGFYIAYSSFVGIWNSWTNSSSQPFYIRNSNDVTLANGSWMNVDYEGFGLDSSARVTVRNITFSGLYASYFFEAYYSSEILVDNVTTTHTFDFAYMEGTSFSTFNRVNASIGEPAFSVDYAYYLFNVTDLNFTNSRYRDFRSGLYVGYASWNLRVFNVTFSNLTDMGLYSTNSDSGNFTVSQSRFEALAGAAFPAPYGLYFQNLQDRLLLSGLNVSGFDTGIFVDPMTNVTITGSQINNTTMGIHLVSVTNSAVTSNTLRDMGSVGIRVSLSTNVTVSLNSVVNGGQVAIDLDTSTASSVSSNTIQGGQVGIRAAGGYGHLVSGNTANATTDAGLFVTSSHYSSTFNSNTLTNGYQGIHLDSVQFLTLDSNVMSGNEYNFRINAYWIGAFWHRINATNTVDGKPVYFIVNGSGGIVPTTAGLVILANTTNYLVSGSTIGHNYHGILLFESSGITVLNVTVATSYYAVEALSTINSSIRNSRFDGGYYGLLIEYATNFLLQGNTVNGSNYGVYFQGGRNVTLDNTSVNASLYTGLTLWYTDASNLTGNRITNTTYGGVDIGYSSGLTLYANNITGNRYSFYMNGYDIAHFAHTIPANNTVDGLQIFYRINTSDVVAPVGTSLVIFANVTNGTVTGLRLNNTGAGIILFGSRSINISSLVLANGNAAIRAMGTQNLTVWNISSDRSDYYFMGSLVEAWYESSNVSIVNSTLTGLGAVLYAYYAWDLLVRNLTLGDLANYSSVGMGLQAYGKVNNVTLDLVNFSFVSYGFYAYGYSDSEKISNVTVSNSSFGYNTNAPVYVASPYTENFSFFHNNFDMTYATYGNMQPYDPYNVTTWHRSYPAGGNYWSNWTSPDSYGGAGQNLSGGDGIVDYSFDGPYTWDPFPLVDPWPPRTRLLSPANLSAILPGTVLDFYVPLYFDSATYSVNNGSSSTFSPPHNLSTSGWAEGVYRVWVNGSDGTGVSDSQFFVFAVDTTAPSISAASPAPGGLYAAGTLLNYAISDLHLAMNATFDLGGGQVPFGSPWNVSTAGWPDGWWNVTVRAWDTAGNGASSTFNYAIDGNAPSVALNSPSNNSIFAAGTTVDLSVSDAFFQNASWSTGAGWSGLSAPFDISTAGWADGATTLVVVAFDQLGRQTVRSYAFTLDSTAPTVTLNTPVNGSTIQAGTALDLSVSDANFQNASWSNGSSWIAIGSPFDILTAGWPDGATSVTVRAFDAAGNVRTSVFAFTFDSTAPAITLVSPSNNSVIAAGVPLDFTVSDANLNTVTRNNGSGPIALASPYDIDTAGWPDGLTSVTVLAVDLAGNARTRVFTFTFDSTQPTITLVTPANNSVIQAGTTLDFSVTDANLNTVTRNNGSGAVSLSSPFDVATGAWPDGATSVTIIATDLAGNSRTRVFTFTFDSTRPAIALNAPGNNSVISAGTTLDFAVTDANAVTATWNNGSGANAFSAPFDVATAGWADSTVNVTIVATDAAGNVRTNFFTFTFDSTLPTVTLTAPANNSYLQAGSTLDFAVSDAHFASATWNNGSGAVALGSPFDVVTTSWPDGAVSVTVIALDTAGNSRTVVFYFTMDSTPPAVALSSPGNNTVWNAGVTLDFAVSDTNLNTVTWNRGGANSTLGSPYDISTTGWAEADYTVTVRAVDLAGNARVVLVLIGIDDTAPTITLNQPTNGSTFGAGTTIDLSVTDAHSVTATRNNGSGDLALPAPFDIDTTAWTNGSYTVVVNATDAAGNLQSRSYSFTIDNAFPAVLLNSPANNSVILPGTTLDFDIVDTDLNTVTWDNGSGSNTFSPPYDIATTGWSDGHVNITVVASDNSSHTVTVSFHFIVDSVLPTVVLNSPANNSVIAAGTSIDLSVTDLNLGSVTWNNGSGAVGLPAPFDVPTGGWADGEFDITVVATDLAGNSRTAVFHYSLDSTAPSIAFVSPANNSVVVPGTTLDFGITDAHSFSATRDNGSGSVALASPFDVSTSGWADGPFDVTVTATDAAGNAASRIFHVTLDSLLPAVSLLAPGNGSYIPAGTTLDLAVSDVNLQNVSWTNGSGWNALASPFDISTAGWADGSTTVSVAATDLAGNRRNALFVFTFDSTPPSVTLVAGNNSWLSAGAILDFVVSDANLATVTWNNTSGALALPSPYDLSTLGWADGPVDLEIVALDLAGNGRSLNVHVVMDSTQPTIALVSPANNSVISPGTTLDFAVSDANLDSVTRNNGTGPVALASPFDVPTSGWPEGPVNVTVTATDLASNSRVLVFRFTVDGTAPTITLVSPANGSAIRAGTSLDLTVTDTNGVSSATWDNGSGAQALVSPFDVSTTAWDDGAVTVTVVATDIVGNERVASFVFMMDSTPPAVALVAPSNNSVIPPGAVLDFAVTDANGIASATRNNGSGNVVLPSPYDLSTSGWADGPVTVVVNATDAAGNFRQATFQFTVDGQAPAVALVSPANNSVIAPGALLDFTVADLNLAMATWNNGSGAVNFSTPFDVPTDGWPENTGPSTTNVTVVATDLAGNAFTLVVRFTLDATAPSVSLISPANNSVIAAGVTLDVSVADAHPASATWNNGSGAQSLPSPFDISTAGWANGPVNVTITALDAAGNTRTEVFRFTIDSAAPNITLVAPANNSVIAAGFVLDISIVEPNLNNASWTNSTLWAALTAPFDIATTGWVDGAVTVYVSATDLAGNTRVVSFRFTMDSTPPTLILSSPANGSVVAPGTVLDFDSADSNFANATWNNGSGANPLPDPFDLSTAGWPEGNRNITVTVLDLAGNARTLVTFLRFDGTPPTVTLVTPANNTIILAGTVIDLTVSDLHLDTVTWDNGSGANGLASPYNIATTGWADGTYNITVLATDLAGNARYVVLRYTFDTTPPTVTLLTPSNNSFVRAGTLIDLLIADLTALTVTYDYGGGPNTLASPFDINTTGWGDGATDVTVLAVDAVGNSRSRVFRFTFDSTLPAVSLLSPTNNSVIRPGTAINFSISDANLDAATWDNGGGSTGFSVQWSISTAGWSDQPYNITVDASDLAGNVRTRLFRFTVDSVLPTVNLNTPTNNSYIAAGTVINLTISDLNLATATWDEGTGAQSFATMWNISTAGWSDQAYNITVFAVDGAGNSRTRIFRFTIDSTLPTVTLLSPLNNSYLVAGALINFTITDTNLNTATWDIGSGAQSFATQWNISTAGWADGSYFINVTAVDLAGNSRTRMAHFTVDSTAPGVSLTSPGNNSYVDAGTTVALAISDANFNSATWDTGSGPQGFATQWNISTAGYADGSYNFTVVATDLAGNRAFRVYRVWVDSTVPVIAIGGSTPANGSYFNGAQTLQFDITEAHLLSATWNNGTSGNVAFSAPFQVSTTGWQDGVFDLAIRASDRAGHQAYFVYRFTVDLTPPSIALTSPANGSYVDAGTVLTLAIADTNMNTATWDRGTGAQTFAAQWTISTAGWADASYNVTVIVTDLAGNSRTGVYHIWIDSTVPVIALNPATPPNNSAFDSGAALLFDVTEAHVATATWNNGTSGDVSFGAPFQVSTAGWQDAPFNLTVRVADRAGHSAFFVYRFTLDSLAPVIADVPWEGGYFPAGWLLNGTYADTNLLWWNFQVDLLPALNGTSSGYQVSTALLPDGAHSIRVQAGDRAGHVTTRVFGITIDSDPPQIQNILPADGSFFRPGTLITFTVIDNNTANVTWQRNLGAILPANGTGGLRNINTSTWGDGNWTVRIRASDLAGHLTTVVLTLVTDATPPAMPSSLATNQSYDEDADVPLDATSALDGGNPLPDASFVWVFTDRLGPLALGPLVGRQVTYSGWTQPGDFEFTLTITDLAGNSANRTYGVHINDITPPEIRLSAPASADEDTPVLLDGSQTTDNDPTFLSNDPSCAGGRFEVRASDGATVTIVLVGVGGPSPTACLAPSHTFPEPGVYSITFNITDKSGNGNSTSWLITVRDTSPPEVSGLILPAVVNEGATLLLDATGTTDNDPANLSLVNYTWAIRRIGGALSTRYGSLVNFTFVDPGEYVVNLTARDVSGNRNSTVLPMRVNDIPVLGNSPPPSLTLPENMDFRLAITDADLGDSFNVTNVTPAGIAVGVDSLTGRPRLTWAPSSYGPFTINFTLSDGFAWVHYSFNITIRVSPTNNPPPVWDNTALGELRESVTYTYDANAHDPAGDTVYYGLTVGPPGMSIDYVTGIVTWYHTLRVATSDQVFDVHIFAWDGANYIWQNYTVRLRATPNVGPVIDPAGAWSTVTVEEGASVTLALGTHIQDPDDTVFDISATTFDADKVTVEVITVSGLPALRISGLLQGSATISLRVADGSQAFDTQDISVTVTPRATTPPGGGESGIGGLIPLIGLAAAGAGAVGFLIVMRGRKQRREEPAASLPGAAVSAVGAPTLAAEAGTVVVKAETAALAAALPLAAAAAPEKKITYTIEGLFVIYKDGRLLYSKTDMGQAKFEDPELVSSMFTAVQSFIKDSFSSEGELNKMGYGDNQIIIERGRSVFTAAIVYGEPDQEFHDAMKAAIENVELSYAGIIEEWDGMMDAFADMDQKLAGVIALSAGITRREVQLATTKQEVLMLSELEFFQGFVRLKCGIKNNTPSVITKATVDIEYNEDVLRLARVEPAAYRTAGAKVLLGVLNPGEKSSVAYYFDPQICTESQIDGVCRYRDASGVLHTVAMKTRKAEVVCPLFFTKEHANTAMLKRLVEAELSEKDSKVFEIQKIPPYIKHKDVFDLIKSVVNAHDVQMVREFTKFNPFHGEAWFYGETKVKGYKIVIRATVIEETNAIEFFAASTNMKAITGLLAEFNHTLNSMVIEKYSDLKIAQIFDSETKAEIEKKSLMSNMSSAELEGAETEQGGDVSSTPGPAEPALPEDKPETEEGLEIPEPDKEPKKGDEKPDQGGGQAG